MKEPYQGKRLIQNQTYSDPNRSDLHRQEPPREAYLYNAERGRGGERRSRLERFVDENTAQTKENFSNMLHLTKRERTWVIIISILLVILLAAIIGMAMWIHAPDMLNRPSRGESAEPELIEQDGEELIDDGYTGDLPTVSGNRKDGVYTFLLVGTDKGGGNTDTIMVASYDVNKQSLNIMSIPRDTMINAPWDLKKINSVYSRYTDGMAALRKQIKNLIGFDPDFYIKVDLGAFVELVDLIGGINFDVPRDMDYDDPYQDLHIHIKKGPQTLDGENAMGLIRWRHNNDNSLGYASGDIGRIELQQSFMKAVIQQCISIKNWAKIKDYIRIAADYIDSDLTVGEMIWFAGRALNLDMEKLNTVTMPGNYIASAYSRSCGNYQSYVTPYGGELVGLINASFNPYVAKVTLDMVDIMSINDDGTVSSSTGVLRDTKANLLPEPEETDETEPGDAPGGEDAANGTDAAVTDTTQTGIGEPEEPAITEPTDTQTGGDTPDAGSSVEAGIPVA